jgi:lipopolysaccharide biosynthesis glycosyltransferase
MSLAKYAHALGFDLEPQSDCATALVFVLDSGYLPGLKTLCYSLCVHKSLLHMPVLVISNDPAVVNDDFINLIADQTRLISEQEISEFQGISAKRVEKRLRLKWIPKYTYLKWFMFDEYGYDRLLFIDTDIVCLKAIDDLLEMTEADLIGGPVFGKSLRHGKEGKLSQQAMDRKIWKFSFQKEPKGTRLNTGVLGVSRKLLDPAFRNELIAYAERHEFSVEQVALRSYVSETEKASLKLISPTYNFNHFYLDRLSAHFQTRALGKIKLLHFAGALENPWTLSSPRTLPEFIWHAYERDRKRSEALVGLA